MRFLYKPFGIVFGVVAALLSKRIFEAVWRLIDDEEPPDATTHQATWPKVLGAAAVQGATFKVTRAAVDRAGARGFERLTGFWPGPERTQRSDESES
jgi:xanthosine utilization system XapX-like protein